MREDADQNNSEYKHFSHSDLYCFYFSKMVVHFERADTMRCAINDSSDNLGS